MRLAYHSLYQNNHIFKIIMNLIIIKSELSYGISFLSHMPTPGPVNCGREAGLVVQMGMRLFTRECNVLGFFF